MSTEQQNLQIIPHEHDIDMMSVSKDSINLTAAEGLPAEASELATRNGGSLGPNFSEDADFQEDYQYHKSTSSNDSVRGKKSKGEHKDAKKAKNGAPVKTTYIELIGGIYPILGILVASLASNLLRVYSYKYLIDWTLTAGEATTKENVAQLMTFILLWLVLTVLGYLRRVIELCLTSSVSTKTHNKTISSLLHARLAYFSEPGSAFRIRKKLTTDMQLLDKQGVAGFSAMLNKLCDSLAILVAVVYTTGPEMAVFIALWIALIVILEAKHSKRRLKQEKRLEASRLPVLIEAETAIKGLLTMQTTRGVIQLQKAKFVASVQKSLASQSQSVQVASWLNLRVSLTQIVLIQLPAVAALTFYYEDSSTASLAFFFVCLLYINEALTDAVFLKTEADKSIRSTLNCSGVSKIKIERGYKNFAYERNLIGAGSQRRLTMLKNYEKQREELEVLRRRNVDRGNLDIPENLNLESVVKRGSIIFENVSSNANPRKMRAGLKSVSFKIRTKETIGLVSKLGGGTVDLVRLLWRAVRPTQGRIYIDGQNISQVDLRDLRSQMSIVTPRDHLFEGTLRFNLDPTGFKFKDNRLITVLDRLLFSPKLYERKGLDMIISEKGANLTPEEVYLVSFARAMLRPNRLVVIHEARFGVENDQRMDDLVRGVMREFFYRSTIVIVAEKVDTVMNCDRVMVLNNGEMVDFDAPTALLKRDGVFKDILMKMSVR